MLRMPSDVERVVERKLPGLREAVDGALKGMAEDGGKVAGILMAVDQFAGSPAMMLEAVWYVTGRGVAVTFPGSEDTEYRAPKTIITE